MHIYVLVLFALAPLTAAFANPIPKCQHLLLNAKEHLAQVELETFDRLRGEDATMPKYLRGLLIAVYDADLDDEPLNLSEAYTYIAVSQPTALRYIETAVNRGLLVVDPSMTANRTRKVRPGPLLSDLIQSEMDAHLFRIYETVRALEVTSNVKWGIPDGKRSVAIDRLLLNKMWAEYDRTWQPGVENERSHLRHSYGLLAHLYKVGLHDQDVNAKFVTRYIPLGDVNRRRQAVEAAVAQGLIDAQQTGGFKTYKNLRATPKTAEYVERRINLGIERTNAILRKLAEERE